MRDDQRNYIVVGVFVIAMFAGLVLWIAMLSGGAEATEDYYIRYEAVPGLKIDAAIYFDGYSVGRIKSIEPIDDGDPQRFWLDVSIRKGWKIPADSQAKIVAGFLSAVFVNIEGGDSTTMLAPGSQIPSVEAVDLFAMMTETASGVSETIEALKPKIDIIVGDLSRTMDHVNAMLSAENAERIATILENLEAVSAEAKAVAAGLGGSREKLDHVLLSVDGVVANADRALDEVNELIAANQDNLSQSIVDLHESLEALARHADAIASNLEVTTQNASEFSQQIRKDPGVLLRGRSTEDDTTGSK